MRVPVSGHKSERGALRVLAASARGDQLPNLIVFVACFALLAAAVILNPPDPVTHNVTLGHQHLPSVCTFKNLTGQPCPGCGLVRSTAAMVHGDVAGSLTYHRLGWLVLFYIVAQLGYRFVLLVVPGRYADVRRFGRTLQYGLIVVASLLAANWIYTLIT